MYVQFLFCVKGDLGNENIAKKKKKKKKKNDLMIFPKSFPKNTFQSINYFLTQSTSLLEIFLV